ncbi:hypothetical protein [Antarctobacter heliothermus]|uniref:Uncharacterized protein n=1 Tax=Antarctobacter heliothermus TaxID=74033 RepID=A0A239GI91_9RHOB|nr:hypothetical protein [Antarctobacter heliothermus]SNS69006.1 hypothetical protein SAMN04488078_10275 [Antarctobacter heliothermus]
MARDFNDRILFDDDRQVMEVDFSDFTFDTSETVNRVYDRIEDRIAKTGEELWFFLINLNGTRIDSSAWVAYARRGRALNLAHSMGSVRFDASPETAAQIERAALTEAFDPNLLTCRADALVRIGQMPSRRRARVQHDPNYVETDFFHRLTFDEDTRIMEADFSWFTFHHSRDVNDFYDHIEARIAASGRDKWFFLINYEGTQILPAAWVQYAHRGKTLNLAHSLGSVRYAPGSETEADIRLRAQSQDFRPNIRNTRDEALARIEEMRTEHDYPATAGKGVTATAG